MAGVNVVAIIQARMGSTRLPGKVLRELGGETVLARVMERTRACDGIHEVLVATTTRPADEAIVAESARRGVRAFRGSEDDVLARYYEAARYSAADVVIRVTSDCPLLDPQLMHDMLRRFLATASERRIDYLSNTVARTYPRGLDTEIFRFAALETAHREATKRHEREHVTPFIWGHPERFVIEQHGGTPDRSGLRWTLDTEEDWQFLSAVFGLLQNAGLPATTANVLELVAARPELAQINADVSQKEISRE